MVHAHSRRPVIAILVGISFASSIGAARVKSSEEIDWRKVSAALGVVGAAAPPRAVRGQQQDLDGGKAQVVEQMVFDIQAGGHQVPDRRGLRNKPLGVDMDALAKLVTEQMARYGISDGMLLKDTMTILPGVPVEDQAFLREVILNMLHKVSVSNIEDLRLDTQNDSWIPRHLDLASEQGPDPWPLSESTFVTVKRFEARNNMRTPKELKSLKRVLNTVNSLSEVGSPGGSSMWPFVKVYSASHTAETLEKDPDAEVSLILEPFSMSMRGYFQTTSVNFWRRCAMFSRILLGLDILHDKKIVHNAVVTPDNIFMAGDLTRPDRARPVFCPSVFHRADRICTLQDTFWHVISGAELPPEVVRPKELLKADLVQAGELFEWMILTAKPDKHTDVRPFLALARCMKAGIYEKMYGVQGAAYAFENIAFRSQLIKTYRVELERRWSTASRTRVGIEVGLAELEAWLNEAEEELREITVQLQQDLAVLTQRQELEDLAMPAAFSALQESEEHSSDEGASELDREHEEQDVAQEEPRERTRSEGKAQE